MSSARTYLDWNATAPLRPQAHAAVLAALDVVGNPSSPHGEGRRARALIEDAREQVAALVNAQPSEVVFTSGGTEANNTVLRSGWQQIFMAGVEHDSVLAPARASAARVVDVCVDQTGVLGADALEQRLACAHERVGSLLSLQLANNETGVLQPIAEISRRAKAQGLTVHTDAVQAIGRIPVDVRDLGVDLLTVSAHKLGGPKGVGALIVREHAAVGALVAGGGQERRRRAGTENVAAIAGFGAAAAAAQEGLAGMARVGALRDRLERDVRAATPAAVVIGEQASRLPNTSSLALAGTTAEMLVIALDLAGIAVSAGAACSSGKVGTSHVAAAMGLDPRLARAAIRVSLGWTTTERDVAAFVAAWSNITARRVNERAVA